MNKRIEELAKEAGLKMCECGCDAPNRQTVKFAELIIEECAKQADYFYTRNECVSGRDIKEHFGVK